MILMAEILRLLLGQTDMFGKECCCVHTPNSRCYLSADKTFTGQQNLFAVVAYKFTEWVIQVTNTDSMWAKLFRKCQSWSKEFCFTQWNDYRPRNTNAFFFWQSLTFFFFHTSFKTKAFPFTFRWWNLIFFRNPKTTVQNANLNIKCNVI